MSDQLDLDALFAIKRTPGVLSIDALYDLWRMTDDGKRVYDELVYRANLLYQRGWRHYGAKAIIETIRYDAAIKVGPEGGFKINNNYTSRLAREAIQTNPHLKDFFELRELRS